MRTHGKETVLKPVIIYTCVHSSPLGLENVQEKVDRVDAASMVLGVSSINQDSASLAIHHTIHCPCQAWFPFSPRVSLCCFPSPSFLPNGSSSKQKNVGTAVSCSVSALLQGQHRKEEPKFVRDLPLRRYFACTWREEFIQAGHRGIMAAATVSSAACISQSANGSIISTRCSSEVSPRQHSSTSNRCVARVGKRQVRRAISRSGSRYLQDLEAGRSLLKRVTLRGDWDSRLVEKDQYPKHGIRATGAIEAKPDNIVRDVPEGGNAGTRGVDNGKDRLSKVPISHIRNFSIIAHIDHGKSTLADKLLQTTGTVLAREMKEQFLDNMDLERERGITIKLQAARMRYVDDDTREAYCLNLIDTPGHVDFSYEVSRSLAACEGALLVVDASQGVEAQTLANVYLALESNLEIIPVLNKIDLPGADPERVRREIEEMIGLDCSEAILCSAKEGLGIPEILKAVVKKIPAPKETRAEPLRALIFDSYYDSYRGVVVYFRVMDGVVKKGDNVQFMASGKEYQVDEVGVLSPVQMPVKELFAGEVGYLSASIRSVADARVGDTITTVSRKATEALPGYQLATPMVFCGLFPIDADQFVELREALEKLQLNDAALQFEPETSSAMGFGFRCGFLGLLHMEIVQERLEREYNLNLITTAPSVVYRVHCTDGSVIECSNPSALPDAGKRRAIEEPYVRIELLTPKDYIGPLMELAQDRRGEFKEMKFLTENRASLVYMLPLGEMVGDFFDQLKSRSKGYASMEYSVKGYRESKLVKLDILINEEPVDPLAVIVHQDKAYSVGRALTQKLKKLIPRQLFKIPIQATIGSKVIASEAIAAMRKDVLAKCYGGDISRKKKLLKKQAEGKKRMKSVGRVDVPQDAFMAILRLEKEVV